MNYIYRKPNTVAQTGRACLVPQVEVTVNRHRVFTMQSGDVIESFADIDKSIVMLDYKLTTNVIRGINNFINWYREYYNVE
jgi:hypothetical protein